MKVKQVRLNRQSDPYLEAQRQQSLADLLQQRSMAPPSEPLKRQSQGTVSALSSIANALMSNYQQKQAGGAQQAVQARTDQATADYNKMSGIPEMQLPALGNREPIQLEGSGRDAIANALTNKYSSPGLLARAQMDYQGMEGDKARQENAQARQEQLRLAGDLKREQIAQQGQTTKDVAGIVAQSRTDAAQIAADARSQGRLGQNQQYGPDGQIQFIPNTPQYTKAAQAHSKDYGSLESTNQSADVAIKKIDQILSPENKVPFDHSFGGYNAALITSHYPDALDLQANIESLKNDMKIAGLAAFRAGGSIGQMTEREWPIVEGMIATITPKLSETGARKKLGEIRDYMNSLKIRARQTYDSSWQDSQFYAPPEARKPAQDAPVGGNDAMSAADKILGL